MGKMSKSNPDWPYAFLNEPGRPKPEQNKTFFLYERVMNSLFGHVFCANRFMPKIHTRVHSLQLPKHTQKGYSERAHFVGTRLLRTPSQTNTMLLRFSSVLLLVGAAASSNHQNEMMKAFTATIAPIPGTNSTVSGTAVVVTTDKNNNNIFYGGFVQGLEPDIDGASVDCTTATNGCGFHIHAGTGCDSKEAQGGHYFVVVTDKTDDVVKSTLDPWLTERYSTNEHGWATVGEFIDIGTTDVQGRALLGKLLLLLLPRVTSVCVPRKCWMLVSVLEIAQDSHDFVFRFSLFYTHHNNNNNNNNSPCPRRQSDWLWPVGASRRQQR